VAKMLKMTILYTNSLNVKNVNMLQKSLNGKNVNIIDKWLKS